MKFAFLCLTMLAASLAGFSFGTVDDKVTVEEVISKHLESIGKADDRQKMFNITGVGEVAFTKGAGNKAPMVGKAVFATEGPRVLMAMNFPSSVYQKEQIQFDGKDVRVDFSTPGLRSILGNYLYGYTTVIKDGLFMGALNKGWAMLDLASHDANVTYEGTKKVNGTEAYVLQYSPKKGSDVRIRLYFDKQTFRHIRTEYYRTNFAGMGRDPNTSARLTDNQENLTEDFSDFTTQYGVTLPRTYKIHMYVERNNTNYENTYIVKFSEFMYNSKFEAGTFGPEVRP